MINISFLQGSRRTAVKTVLFSETSYCTNSAVHSLFMNWR